MPDRSLDAMPSSFDDDVRHRTSGLQRLMAKVKREPFIPIGVVATVAALTGAIRAIRKGNHRQVQVMFRARILAQGFTIVAIVIGGVYLSEERQKEREEWKMDQQMQEEEKRNKWIRELEARDAEEKQLQELEAKRDQRRGKAGIASAAAAAGAPDAQSSPVLSALGWFGGGKKTEGEDKSAAASPFAAAEDAPTATPGGRNNSKGTSQLGMLGDMFSKKGGSSNKDGEEKK